MRDQGNYQGLHHTACNSNARHIAASHWPHMSISITKVYAHTGLMKLVLGCHTLAEFMQGSTHRALGQAVHM